MAETIAKRLQEARERADRSIRSLQRELHDAGVPGTSYANVHAYFTGKTTPSVEFLQAAARTFGVQLEWLITGEGEPTEAEEKVGAAAREAAEQTADLYPGLQDVLSDIADGFGQGAGVFLDHPIRRAQLTATWMRLEIPEFVEDLSLARRLGEALAAPLRALDIDPENIPPDALTDYTTAATMALRHLCPDPLLVVAWRRSRAAEAKHRTEEEEQDG